MGGRILNVCTGEDVRNKTHTNRAPCFYSNVPPKIKYLDRSRILYRNLIAEIVDNFRRILVLNAEAEYNYISAKVRENKRRWH